MLKFEVKNSPETIWMLNILIIFISSYYDEPIVKKYKYNYNIELFQNAYEYKNIILKIKVF